MADHLTQIVNQTGQTIRLKVVGHQPDAHFYPGNTGVLFAAAPLNQVTDFLLEGLRAVIVWNNNGSTILGVGQANINGPSTVTIATVGGTVNINQAAL
jgi:hypothetical protein